MSYCLLNLTTDWSQKLDSHVTAMHVVHFSFTLNLLPLTLPRCVNVLHNLFIKIGVAMKYMLGVKKKEGILHFITMHETVLTINSLYCHSAEVSDSHSQQTE